MTATPAGPGRPFRFGFACVPADHSGAGEKWSRVVRGWSRIEVDGLVIRLDAETPLHERTGPGGHAILIGEAFATPGEDVGTVLDELLATTSDGRFFERFEALSGRFALIVMTDGVQRVLHDPIGSRSVYYRIGAEPCLASHAELVASAYGHGRSADAAAILASEEYRSRTVKYLPGDLTVYENVHGLSPNSYYDIADRQTVRYWPREPRRPAGFDRFAGVIDGHLEALAVHLAGRDPILGISGGIDTRMLIAAFRAHELPFHGVTWLRRKGGVAQRELEIVESVIAHTGPEHTFLDLSKINDELRQLATLAKRNAGRFGKPSRITAHMLHVGADPRAVFIRGYGAEIVRGFYNLPSGSSRRAPKRRGLRRQMGRLLPASPPRPVAVEEPDPAELLRAYDSSMRVDPGAEHVRLGLAAFTGFAERASFDDDLTRFGFDLSDLFYWEHRMGMWGSAKHNEMDPAVLSIAGFNSRPMYEAAFGLGSEERLTKELLARVIAGYDEALARIPYL
jgi:hypothetical protein